MMSEDDVSARFQKVVCQSSQKSPLEGRGLAWAMQSILSCCQGSLMQEGPSLVYDVCGIRQLRSSVGCALLPTVCSDLFCRGVGPPASVLDRT